MAEGRSRGRVEGTTRTVGIIGWPVAHSLSPAIHNAAFVALGLDWIYLPLPVPPGRLAEALAGLSPLGFAGANVTMPHKTETAELVDDLSEDAMLLRAVNTVTVSADGELAGHNTDVPGFDRFLRHDAAFDPAGRSVLLYGAGGAARACALALARGGAGSIAVAARDATRTADLVRTVEGHDTGVRIVSFGEATSVTAELIVNATPVGARGEPLPLPLLGREALVVDLLYDPATTPLLQAARDAGATAYGGLGLLLHQAALSFELWTGRPAPLPAMSAAALAELAGGRGGAE